MSKNPKIIGNLDILSNSKTLAGNRNSFEEGGRVLVKGFASKRAAHIAASFLKVLNENNINSQRLLRVEDKRIYLEFLPGQQLKNLRERGIQRKLAHFQAQIHSLDWSGVLVDIDSRQEYNKFFQIYINNIVKNGLISIKDANGICQKFEGLIPEKMFDGPVHGNFWTANILVHDGELFLIDFGSVVKLSLEYDLLYANRTLTRRTESWVKGWCSLDTKYIKHYLEYGEKARLVLRNLEENYSFYYAFLAALKTASSLNANKPKRAGAFFAKLRRILG